MKAELILRQINSRDVDASLPKKRDMMLETVCDVKRGYKSVAAAESSR